MVVEKIFWYVFFLPVINKGITQLSQYDYRLVAISSCIPAKDINSGRIKTAGDRLKVMIFLAISKKFNTTVGNLKKINNLSSNLLSIGQILKISPSNTIYIVKKGDNLYSISKKFNTTVDNLKKLNIKEIMANTTITEA